MYCPLGKPCASEIKSTHARRLVHTNVRCDSSFPDLYALPCRIGALRTSIDTLATDAAQVIRERNVGEGLEGI